MLSVFQVCAADDVGLPYDVGADPLSEAISHLIDDRSRGSESARLRALTALLSHQAQERPAYRRIVGELVDAVRADRRVTYGALKQQIGRRAAPHLAPPSRSTILNAAREKRDTRAEHALRSQLVGQPDELRRIPITSVRHTPRNLVSRVTGTVEVRTRPHDVAPLIDPRRWHEYNPVFRESYRTAVAPDGAVQFDEHGTPRKAVEPEGNGRSWSGVLYEDVAWQMNTARTGRFRNLLNVGFRMGRDRVQTTYSLYRCLSSELWCVERPGGIDVDGGTWAARDVGGGWTELKLVKKLRFTDATPRDASAAGSWDFGETMNCLAPAFLGMWIDAVLEAAVEHIERRAGPMARDEAVGGASHEQDPVGS